MNRYQYSSDPVADASRYYDALYADAEDAARTEDSNRQAFLDDCFKKSLNETNTVGEYTIDYTGPLVVDKPLPKRACTVAEVLYQSLDWPNGPSVDDLIYYVVVSAKSGEPGAIALLDQMARAFARNKV